MTSFIDDRLDPIVQANIERWLNESYDEKTKNNIIEMLKDHPADLIDAFYGPLKFGTAGLRGIMGIGPNRINEYTIRSATQGLSDYINTLPAPPDGHLVLIGFDSRHGSKFFAEEAAKVFAGNQIKVLIFKELRPVPLLSFGCRYKKCSAAIMITASHNPPQYNGYKIYWNDGSQILSPHESSIIKRINEVSDPKMVHAVSSLKNSLITVIDDEVEKAYLDAVGRLQNCNESNSLNGSQLKIVYTSLHGTGITLIPQIFNRWGFTNIHYVENQIIPDGNFPTAPFPNPEDPNALKLGLSKLNEIEGDLLIATDPDGDRIGVAFRENGKAIILNGNQIAALVLNHVCNALSSKNKLAANAAFIKSVVTTELLQEIAGYYQKPCFNVPPGFKYITEKIRQWENEPRGHQFIFGAEESHGYLYGSITRDKDAIAIAALVCEIALQAKLKGKTLNDLLHDLFSLFGVFDEVRHIMKFEEGIAGKEKIAKCMQRLRRLPPRKISGINILSLEDFEQSIKIDFITHQVEPLQQPKTDLLLFWLEDGSKLVVRPSGTEPIIKIHCCVVDKQCDSIESSLDNCRKRATEYANALESILNHEWY